jgi:hypothetical protein
MPLPSPGSHGEDPQPLPCSSPEDPLRAAGHGRARPISQRRQADLTPRRQWSSLTRGDSGLARTS